jgi:hypothetical protein
MDPEAEIAKHEAALDAWRAQAAAEVDELVASERARLQGEVERQLAAAVADEQRLDRQHRLRQQSAAAQPDRFKAEAERRAAEVGEQLETQRQTVAKLGAGLADALAQAHEQAAASGAERAAALVEPPALVERIAELREQLGGDQA